MTQQLENRSRSDEYRAGWRVLLASALGTGAGVAVLMAYTVGSLVEPLVREFGWSRTQVGAAPLFYAIATVMVGPLVGAVADRYGSRRVAITSQVLLAVAFALLSRLGPSVGLLYAGYFLLAVFGAGTLPVVWSRAITGWFVRSRGFALGLSLIGTGAIGALLPSYTSWLVGAVGWRGAFLGIAALPVVVGMPLALLYFRDPPGDLVERGEADGSAPRQRVDGEGYGFRQAIRTLCFWQMSLSFMVVAIAVSAVLSHAQLLLMDRGIPRTSAAALIGLFGLAISLGRLVSGYFLDLVRGPAVAFVMFALPVLACILLLVAGDNLLLCGAAIVLVGLAGGAEHDIAAFFTARYFGRANFAAIYGLLYALYGLGGGFGPLLAGAVHDSTGSYDAALYGGIGVFMLAATLIGTLRAPGPKAGG